MIIIMKKRMKSLWILVTLLNVTFVKSETFPECDLQSEGASISPLHKIFITDDQSGSVMELNTVDVVSANLAAEGAYKYFIVAFESTTLTLSTSPEYVNMEQNEPSQSEETTLKLAINLDCGNANILFLDVVIADKNNQPTEFPNKDITYTIPLPLPAKVPLHLFTDTPNDNKLTARDADISNHIITFEINPDNVFNIFGEKDTRDPLGKTFVANIVAKMPLTNLPSKKFTITAKDKDAKDPPTMEITINIDEAASLPASPVFENKFYEAQYLVSDEGVHSLEVETLVINNPSETYPIVAALDQGAIGDFFKVNYDTVTKAVTLSKHTDLTKDILDDNDFLTLWVQVKYEDVDIPSTSVSVLVTLPSKEQSVEPAFPKSIYTAVYNKDTNAVTLDDPILVNIEELDLKFKDSELSTHFGVEKNSENPLSIEITVSTPLPPEEIEKNEYISLVLTATVADVDHGSTVIIIDIPSLECPTEPPESIFTQVLYKGEYIIPDDGDHEISFENIQLTSADEVTVVIEPNDYPDNFRINNEDPNEIKLEIIQNLEEDILDDFEVISMILVAKSADGNIVYGSSVAILDLPPAECLIDQLKYAFSNPLYEGTYKPIDPPIVTFTELIKATATESLLIDIKDGDFKEYFTVEIDEVPIVKIIVRDPIPESIINENEFITLVLTAKGSVTNDDYGEAGLVIDLPSAPIETIDNVFGQSLYEGTYITSAGLHTVTFVDEITATSANEMNIDFIPSGFSKYFGIDFTQPPNVEILVKENIPQEDLDANDFITLVLSAKSTDGITDYGETGLVIDLPDKCSIEPSDDIFVGTVFDGEYIVSDTGSHTVTTVPISVRSDEVVVSIVGDYSRNFKVDVTTEKQVILSIEEELTEDIWNDHSYISILLQGTSAELTGAARVILSLPEAECVIPDPDPSITFDVGSFILNPDATGKIGTLVATFDPPEAHTFTISKQPSWVLLDDSDLKIDDNTKLQPGTYRFTATVTGDTSDKKKDAQVTIYVKSSNPGEGKTVYSMIVKEILEEQVNEDILILENKIINGVNYEYVILSQEPLGPKFEIKTNENNEKFLMSGIIDRENILFDGVQVPQVVLTISLQKETTTPNINTLLAVHPLFKHIQKSQNRDGQQCLMLHSEMLREDHIMHVPVIILDKNDNAPVFSTEYITIGYPSKDIVFDINPPYLLKLEATDKDDGGKAPITYATTSTSVKLNPTTGIVYPTEGLYNGERKITFTASDGLNQDAVFVANVLLLDADHISVLVFPNLLLEDLIKKLKELSDAIGVKLSSFSAGSLPLSKHAKLRADSDVQLKAIVYAIDDDDEAVSYKDLMEKLAGNAEVSIIEYIPGSVDPGSSDDPEECDDTGLIAGIAVLAVALVVCIVGFIAFYWKKRKSNASLDLEQIPENKTSFKKSNASQNGYNNEPILKDVSTRRATQHPMGTPKIDPDSSSSSSEDGENFDEARDRRKSVTFNENMQHFDITAKENETNLTKAIVD